MDSEQHQEETCQMAEVHQREVCEPLRAAAVVDALVAVVVELVVVMASS